MEFWSNSKSPNRQENVLSFSSHVESLENMINVLGSFLVF